MRKKSDTLPTKISYPLDKLIIPPLPSIDCDAIAPTINEMREENQEECNKADEVNRRIVDRI